MSVSKIHAKQSLASSGLLPRINLEALELPFVPSEKTIIIITHGVTAGNHRHPRTEAFMALTDNLVIEWTDENGIGHKESMYDKELSTLFIVAPHTPHRVINTSTTQSGLLLECADGPQGDIQSYS